MLTYTKATLKSSLQDWNVNADPNFVAALDEIIRKGELRLMKLLDLECFDAIGTTTTTASSDEVFKPDNLIVDRLLMIDTGSGAIRPVQFRSRAWVAMNNQDAETGVPKYYAEMDETRWNVAPLADTARMIYVHGLYRPASIVDGADANETWFSTRVPELLFLACSIEANEYLKHWARKSANESDLAEQAQQWLGIAARLQRTDVEDLLGDRMNLNKPNAQGVTE